MKCSRFFLANCCSHVNGWTGVLLHGPPGTGKTLLARACAKQTDAIFLKLAGPQLVQMFIGDGAKVIAGVSLFVVCLIVFLCVACTGCVWSGSWKVRGWEVWWCHYFHWRVGCDRNQAIWWGPVRRSRGTNPFFGLIFSEFNMSSVQVQRTMLELLNQLDGFSSNEKIKVGFFFQTRVRIWWHNHDFSTGHCSNQSSRCPGPCPVAFWSIGSKGARYTFTPPGFERFSLMPQCLLDRTASSNGRCTWPNYANSLTKNECQHRGYFFLVVPAKPLCVWIWLHNLLFIILDVNFEELARCTEDFNGAQLKAVSCIRTCVENCWVY
jgi:hypothetical protein